VPDPASSPRGLDLPALQTWFDAHVSDPHGTLSAVILAGGRSNITYRVTDGSSAWVVRRPPLGVLTPSAHDMAREFRIVEALQGTDVPTARTVALCEDLDVIGVPFSVVGFTDGRVVGTGEDVDALADEDVERVAYALVDAFAALHAVDYEAIGLGSFGRPAGYLERQVRRWHDQWGHVATRDLPDVDSLHAQLAERVGPESAHTLVHGDLRIDNAIVDRDDVGRILALVDWEMATLGDPLADLGLHLVYRDPIFEPVLGHSSAASHPRMPSPSALAERYARTSGRDVSDLAFYVALGYFKSAVIAEGIWARQLQGLSVVSGLEGVGAAPPLLAAAGLEVLASGL
jgi:aminoglycoside phosphotransferase (APT) family kinase protein